MRKYLTMLVASILCVAVGVWVFAYFNHSSTKFTRVGVSILAGVDTVYAKTPEEEAEEAAERAAEDAAEAAEEAAEEAEEAAEEAAEQAAEVAEEAAELVQEAAEEAAESVQEAAEQVAEAAEEAAETAQEAAEEAAEQAAEAAEEAAETAQEAAEEAAEQAAEAAEEAAEAAEEAAEQVAEAAEEAAEAAEESAKAAEKVAEESQEVAEEVAKSAEKAAEDAAKEADKAAEQAQESADSGAENHIGNSAENKTSLSAGNIAEATESGAFEKLEESVFEVEFDDQQNEVVRGELLLLIDSAEFSDLVGSEFEIELVQQLDNVGKTLAKITTVDAFLPALVQKRLLEIAPSVEIDRNHVLFEPSAASSADAGYRIENQPTELISLKSSGQNITLGVIDTAVDTGHPVFANAKIVTMDFVGFDLPRPSAHGTSVVSALVGDNSVYTGLLPEATVLSASVFFVDKDLRRVSTSENISKALNWLVGKGVRVINMSFTGPYSRVLDILIKDISQRGIRIVAAAGNQGPSAGPAYPGAYEGAMAVTAVARDKSIYRLANRGKHIVFAAPGVDIYHANAGAGYSTSSGTSMAAPFVSAVLATNQQGDTGVSNQTLAKLIESAEDLGPVGFDPIFGNGLIRP